MAAALWTGKLDWPGGKCVREDLPKCAPEPNAGIIRWADAGPLQEHGRRQDTDHQGQRNGTAR